MLHVVCVQAGDYCGRGAEYVNKLFDAVRRNLPEGFEGRFVVFTDDARGLAEGIEPRGLPGNIEGWWNKLFVMKAGNFAPDDRIWLLDLDTLIVGRLDQIFGYDGPFAALEDFRRPGGIGSGVMTWTGNECAVFWDAWEDAGRPMPGGGDQAWLEYCDGAPVFLQEQFPGAFVSFKDHCHPDPPREAKVVCFHGHPRPHEVTSGWVPEIWKVGGWTGADLDLVCNTALETRLANLKSSLARGLPVFSRRDANSFRQHVAIVGGGPSVAACVDELKLRQADGQDIWSLNGAYGWLLDRGIVPDGHVVADCRPETAEFVARAVRRTTHYVSSAADPGVFDALRDCSVQLVHFAGLDIEGEIPGEGRLELVGGGSTVGLKAMALAYLAGYREMHLYGFDSSYAEGAHHAYPQSLNDGDAVLEATVAGRTFKAAPWMVAQLEEFRTLAPQLADLGCLITVHGDGLLPHVARVSMTARQEAA